MKWHNEEQLVRSTHFYTGILMYWCNTSLRTMTCLFHSGMATPCSSWVGTRASTSTRLPLCACLTPRLPLTDRGMRSPPLKDGGLWVEVLDWLGRAAAAVFFSAQTPGPTFKMIFTKRS
ncbi:hypothetical protein GJAV_G00176410 [Gymnothorax javanicus]|nr:hypothetical protein GJAV_G00176410 [Gymnothorax javanicus]